MDVEVKSSFFATAKEQVKKETSYEIAEEFLGIIDELNVSLDQLNLPPTVECIYNPTLYARNPFEQYIRKYCNKKKVIMFFGMNPGPWGMSQTGVPFGEIKSVRDWLEIDGPVSKPNNEIRERPVKGFACTRTEISGKRFWGLIKDICGSPEFFFKTSFVYNYLNQQWMKSNGCNLTPGDFKVSEMEPLYNICDPVFVQVLKLYEVKIIIAVGKFCETRAQKALKKYMPCNNIEIIYLPHPSPRSRSVKNNNWEQKALEQLKTYDILEYYKQ